jgi:UDP:flavonoid glycosyltransferase YjiC (YdhE family)
MDDKQINTKFKILVHMIPASGHVNPMLPIIKQLIKTNKTEIIVYLTEEFKLKIESVGAQFRPLIDFDLTKDIKIKPVGSKRKLELTNVMNSLLDSVSKNLEYLASEIDNEKPDLIFYDISAMHIKWAIKYYKKWYDISRKCSNPSRLKFSPTWPLPTMIGFAPMFIMQKSIYPNSIERELFIQLSFGLLLGIAGVFIKGLSKSLKHGLGFQNILGSIDLKPDESTSFVIASILPEIQPRSHLFDPHLYKFVGSTIEEINNSIFDSSIENVLISLPEKRITDGNFNENDTVLVYASLGTVFNNNIVIYKKIIEAFKQFDKEPLKTKNLKLKISNLRLVVSLGKTFELIQDLINRKEFEVPENILLVKSAPQIEILKKASLFITHSGMNSTSESIHYGGK